MSITGDRIRQARKNAGLTIKMLSEFVVVSERSIKRYESGESIPDTHALIQLACIFDLSTDYLLALSNRADTSFLDEYRTNNIYYKKVLSNLPIQSENYYCVSYNVKKEHYPMRGQMQWAGFNNKGEELYCLRPIDITKSLEIFKMKVLRKETEPLVVNTKDDFYVFLIYGGIAFVAETVGKECLKHLLRPGTVNK